MLRLAGLVLLKHNKVNPSLKGDDKVSRWEVVNYALKSLIHTWIDEIKLEFPDLFEKDEEDKEKIDAVSEIVKKQEKLKEEINEHNKKSEEIKQKLEEMVSNV